MESDNGGDASLWALVAGPLLLTALVAAMVLLYFLRPWAPSTDQARDDYDRGIGRELEPEPGGIGFWIVGGLLGLALFFLAIYFLSD